MLEAGVIPAFCNFVPRNSIADFADKEGH